MTTKEEIAKKYVPCTCDEIYTNRGLTAPDCPYHSTDPESAMDEYSELIAIKFAEWMAARGYNNIGEGLWRVGHLLTRTTAELFQLFKNQYISPNQ